MKPKFIISKNATFGVVSDIWPDNLSCREFHGPIKMPVCIYFYNKTVMNFFAVSQIWMKLAKPIVRLEHLNVFQNVHRKIRIVGEIVLEKTRFASTVRLPVKFLYYNKQLISRLDMYLKFVHVKQIVQMAAIIARILFVSVR